MSLTPEQRQKRNERIARRRAEQDNRINSDTQINSTEDLTSILEKLDRIEKYMRLLATFSCTDHGVDIDDVT